MGGSGVPISGGGGGAGGGGAASATTSAVAGGGGGIGGSGGGGGGDVEALQIQHKLVFDVINEELHHLATHAHANAIEQLRWAWESKAPALPALQARTLRALQAGVEATLKGMSRNLQLLVGVDPSGVAHAQAYAPPTSTTTTGHMARAKVLARADVRVGLLGDELDDLQEEESLIAALIADNLALELQEEAMGEVD